MSNVRVIELADDKDHHRVETTGADGAPSWRDIKIEYWGLGRDGDVNVRVAYDPVDDVLYVDEPVPAGVTPEALSLVGDLIRATEGL